MAIYLRRSPDPFSERSWDEDPRPILAESDAYRQLRRELERYVTGELNGSSYLISGHRGSGKTTLVLKAIQDVRLDLERQGLRPLLVRLSGPDLLSGPATPKQSVQSPEPVEPSEEADSEKRDNHGAGEEPGKHQADSLNSKAEAALERLTLAIYRALCRQITWSLSRRETGLEDGLSPQTQSEMAAELQLLLDSAPGPGELREYWLRLGCLETGLLFPPTYSRPGQGHRELVATASAAQAYQKLIGKLTKSEQKTSEAKRDSSSALSGESEGKDLIQAVSALIAASAIGVGVAFDQLLAGLTAAAVALFGSWGFNFDLSRAWNRSRSDDYSFILDTSLATLERELPILVERLRSAGLAPIFVVDELDKVEDLTDSMQKVVNHLKQFVSEGAFFCFLTDRDYFETLRIRLEREPYPPEYTYFRDRLLISYRPDDLRKYLKEALRIDTPTDEADREILINVLLHRAYLHVVDLRRELRRMPRVPDDPERLDLEPGSVRSKLGPLLEAAVQIAVEVVYAEEEVQQRLESDPGFAQLMVDALYFASRSWNSGETLLDASETAFHTYLTKRMKPNEGPGLNQVNIDSRSSFLGERDLDELHRLALSVIYLLLDFNRLLTPKTLPPGWTRTFGEILSSLTEEHSKLARDIRSPGVLVVADEGDVHYDGPELDHDRKFAAATSYLWICDRFGRATRRFVRREDGLFLLREPAEKDEAESHTETDGQEARVDDELKEDRSSEGSVEFDVYESGDGAAVEDRQMKPADSLRQASDKQAPGGLAPPLAFLAPEAKERLIPDDLLKQRFESWTELRVDLLELDRAIFHLTDRFDLESLGSELGLLSTTPSWLPVKGALERLEIAESDPGASEGMADEIRLVTRYLEMLSERLPVTYQAYYLVMVAITGHQEHYRLALSNALEALVGLLQLSGAKHGWKYLRRSLERIEQGAREWSGDEALQLQKGLDSKAWSSLRESTWTRFEKSPAAVIDKDALWDPWDDRLKRFLRTPYLDINITFFDLVSRAHQLPPGRLTLAPLRDLRLHIWIDLFYSAIRQEETGHPPPWFALAASSRLGISPSRVVKLYLELETLSQEQMHESRFKYWLKWAESLTYDHIKSHALIVTYNEPRETQEWTVPEEHSCLAIDVRTSIIGTELSKQINLSVLDFSSSPSDIILWEESAVQALLSKRGRFGARVLEHLLERLENKSVILTGKEKIRPKLPIPALDTSNERPDAIIQRALRLISESNSDLQNSPRPGQRTPPGP